MKIVQAILTNNPCYTAGRKIAVKGLMLHSIGCPQPKASVLVKDWNRADYKNACVHAFIDGNTGDIYQTLPWNHRGWHCGGAANNTHISIEMCEPSCIKYTSGSTFTCSDLDTARAVAQRTYKTAVELFAYLCKEYGLSPVVPGVIISHAEGYKQGTASNHGDPEHLWKGLGLSYTMDGFREDVKAAMSGKPSQNAPIKYRVQVGAYSELENAEAKVTALKNAGFDAFIVPVDGEGNNAPAAEPEKKEVKIGSTVRLRKGAKDYNGGSLASFVYEWDMKVSQINGDRVVVTHSGVVIAAVRKSDLTVVD